METRQDDLFCERFEDAADAVCRALGGRKRVAQDLWPTKPARDAHNRLDACLNPDRPEKLAPHEVLFLARRGRDVGCHVLVHFIADECGYERPRPRSRRDERQALEDKIVQAAALLEQATKRLKDLRGGAD